MRFSQRIATKGRPGKPTTASIVERAYLDGTLQLDEVYTAASLAKKLGLSKISFGGGFDNLCLALAVRRSPLKLVELSRKRFRVEAR